MKIIPLVALTLISLSCSENGPHKEVRAAAGGKVQALEEGYPAVKIVFAQYCSRCHPATHGPDWLNFDQAKQFVQNGELIKRAVIRKDMPPPGQPEATLIPQSARNEIQKWASSTEAGGATTQGEPSLTDDKRPPVSPLVSTCFQCHGPQPFSVLQPKIPRIRGQNKSYLMLQLQRFRSWEREDPTETMNDVAYVLKDKDIEELANYFANFFTVPNPEVAPKVASEDEKLFQRGKQLATTQCISCHQNSLNRGLPNDDLLPILAGQSKQYMMVQLFRFKKSEARNNMMHIYAEPLTDKDIEALATFFTFSP
jgi:cytochrome c553